MIYLNVRYVETYSDNQCTIVTLTTTATGVLPGANTATTMLRSVTDGMVMAADLGLAGSSRTATFVFVILHLIAEKPRHGYEIIKAIEEQVGGAYSPSPGVIYPTLTMLEELGHVTVSTGDGGKKLQAITAEGRAYLEAYRPAVAALLARMEEANRVHGGGPAPQIVRAMENMKLALRLRLSRGPLSEEQIDAVAAAIDGAAISVERV